MSNCRQEREGIGKNSSWHTSGSSWELGNLTAFKALQIYEKTSSHELRNSSSVSEAQLYGGPLLYIKMSAVFCQILDHNFKKEFAFRYAHDAGEFFPVLKFDGLPRLLEVISNEFKTEDEI